MARLSADSTIEEDIKAIDDSSVSEEEAEQDEPRKRHEKITLERFIDHGPSPGCTACSEDLDNHTPACRQRFDELIRKTKFDLPDGIPRDRDSWKIEGSKLITVDITVSKESVCLPQPKPMNFQFLGRGSERGLLRFNLLMGEKLKPFLLKSCEATPKLFEAFGPEFQLSTS